MIRIAYSFSSSFIKIFIFLLTLFVGYKVNQIGAGVIPVWQRLPFICLAIYGAKEFVELFDGWVRNRMGLDLQDKS